MVYILLGLGPIRLRGGRVIHIQDIQRMVTNAQAIKMATLQMLAKRRTHDTLLITLFRELVKIYIQIGRKGTQFLAKFCEE